MNIKDIFRLDEEESTEEENCIKILEEYIKHTKQEVIDILLNKQIYLLEVPVERIEEELPIFYGNMKTFLQRRGLGSTSYKVNYLGEKDLNILIYDIRIDQNTLEISKKLITSWGI